VEGHRRRSRVLRENREDAETWQRLTESVVDEPSMRAKTRVSLTPKALRMNELRAAGMSFDEAFAIADRESTPDGLLLRRGVTDLSSVRVEQTGQVQF
jgi:hypothetical protein